MDVQQVRLMKIVLLVSSLLSLAILAFAAFQENFLGEWRGWQRSYRQALLETAPDENAQRAAAAFEVQHKQLYLTELGRIDRCTTCHLGVENPNMASAAQPLEVHPGDLLAYHPVEKFGCTVCHEGHGRIVSRNGAHGWSNDGTKFQHAETPLLRGTALYTSCSKCHYELDLYGEHEDLYARAEGPAATPRGRRKAPLDEALLERTLPGTEDIAAGKRLLIESGCLGCHKYRGRGGVLGPVITHVGDKTVHDFDFRHVLGEHTVGQWLYEHFMVPGEISPGTTMPDMGFTSVEARQLASYMMSLHRKAAPAGLRPLPALIARGRARPIRGETLYNMFCSSCHGADGFGTTLRQGLWPQDADPWGHQWDARNLVVEKRADMEVMVPSLNHSDTLAVASAEYLTHVITYGRPGTKMLGWLQEGGLTVDEILLIVSYIRGWSPKPPDAAEISSSRGDPLVGGALYRANCAACHGTGGEGGIGNALNSPTFLAVASDAFLRDTVLHGRPNTAMPAWRDFSAQEVSDLLAHMRAWQPRRADLGRAEELCAGEETDAVSARVGKILYKANCVMCHGQDGAGDLASSLNTQEFLTAVSDEFLLATMIQGRPGTGMPSWKHLRSEDLASMVRFLRTWQTEPSKPAGWQDTPVPRGDADAGRSLFVSICSGCHGPQAEGASGPQLNNPIFLSTATDRMLKEWISHGKIGTEMKSFRKGGQGVAELSERQLDDVVAYLRSLESVAEGDISRTAKSPHGRPEKGAVLYADYCTSCHGLRGEGASGPALSNRNFLRFASDGFLMATLALGRRGTEMRPVKKSPQSIIELSSDQVNDLVAYLRSWEYDSPFDTPEGREIPHRFVVPWDLRRGGQLFASNCAGCHGVDGKGAWAPELNNEGFLAAATDGFLQATIVRGRKGTAMRPFGSGSQGLVDLSSQDIDDIVAYMRSWSSRAPSPLTIPAERSLEVGRLPAETSRAQGD